MTTDTETKPVEQQAEEKNVEEVKEDVKKEEEAAKNAEEKSDDKAEKEDKEKDSSDKAAKPKKEPAPPKPTVHKADYQPDVVYLYQFMRTPVLPSLSPYCLKVETWLRLAGLKYENVDHKMKYKSKKGQLPFVEVNGEEIADSAIIIKQLGEKFNTDLDAGLSPEQKLIAHSNISMIENHFAWVVKSWRSQHPGRMLKAYKVDIRAATGTKLPNAILNAVYKFFLRRAAKKVRAHGIGVHKPEEIEEFGQNDLKVLSDLLGDKQFFFGETPSTLDVVAFANLAQLVYMDPEVSYSLRDWLLENCANLKGFCDRLKDRAFPDWEEMCSTLDLNSHLPKPPPEEEKKKEEKEEAKEKKEDVKEEKKKEEEKETDEKEKAQKEEDAADKDDNKKTEEKEK
ncbi:failed axon connections isoform X3 [Hyalella azteca]|uniref:Failed axon connections isoform X3 n=1 Tax=Hyalella azteca TaxID=294128 RepID=A0A8B7N6D1_HYAAZ|nr:failed axon connections isoform X3 [Hyalella azteca]